MAGGGGAAAALCRTLFRAAELPYAVAVRCRNGCYDRGWPAAGRVAVPVISVGNLTVGGTGKTPFVGWIAEWYRLRGARVVIISRGYGAAAGNRNDEALELERRLPGVPQLHNPNRVAARTEPRSKNSNRRSCCWTTLFNIGGSTATWISC